ncbi:hypothetical protein BD779DRAFT_1680834 [Infundibulicybe gibba]|nr:hypothetical protein BD779DRAFT_1680834 [Infundibulicybe gibba]
MSSSKPSQPGAADPTPPSKSSCLVQIHRPDDTYHVVLLEWDVGVKKLIAALGQKLGLPREEVAAHRLFIEERGTERVLLPTEWPARSSRDGRERLDMMMGTSEGSYQAKTCLSCSNLLSRNIDASDIAFTNFKNIVSLTLGNSIIPAVTPHFLGHARSFISSAGPIRHPPVPRGLRHAFAIRHLDLSSNRIEGLQDVYLGDMPLEVLLLQNNCISEIPFYFSQFGSLKTLNLSNNNLTSFPHAILSLPISDLDLSFNHISSISLAGSSLPGLQRFLVNGNGLQVLLYGTRRPSTFWIFDTID